MDDRGYRILQHTADLMIESWGPTRLTCFEEAVRALVDSFADVSGVIADQPIPITIDPGPDEEMLVALLEEVVYVVDVFGRVPVNVTLEQAEDGSIAGTFDVALASRVLPSGALPKAVARHQLSVTSDGGRWVARTTIDV